MYDPKQYCEKCGVFSPVTPVCASCEANERGFNAGRASMEDEVRELQSENTRLRTTMTAFAEDLQDMASHCSELFPEDWPDDMVPDLRTFAARLMAKTGDPQ